MKKVEVIVLSLVVVVALIALYFTFAKGGSGTIVYDSLNRLPAPKEEACCFTVYYDNGFVTQYCSFSYRFALTASELMTVEALKGTGRILGVGPFREGPACIH